MVSFPEKKEIQINYRSEGGRLHVEQFQGIKDQNVKIRNWKLELSEYRFDVEYRPGKSNSAAGALPRNPEAKKIYVQVSSISIRDNLLEKLRKDLGCPGIMRSFH